MAIKSLAIKYRPKTWDDVVEQQTIKDILIQQLQTGTIKNAYLFVGGAGTGKTTCARIFADEINNHQGNPIEQDAASNNSVEDARELIQQAKTKSLDSEYKVFIIDECHMLSTAAWNALLKLIEEPPAKSIFIFCTTDPQKIPKTIMSRVQRYDFQRISQQGIKDRLKYILGKEKNGTNYQWETDAVDYIAKIADGGMRDAITMMDKCLSYSENLTMENVVQALGLNDYDTMFELTTCVLENNGYDIISIVENVHKQGKDLKIFMKSYMQFLLDVNKYLMLGDFHFVNIPNTYKEDLEELNGDWERTRLRELLSTIIKLNADIKWDTSPKYMIEATLLLEVDDGTDS